MAGNGRQRSTPQQLELGRVVAAARASGTPWKLLVRVYGRSPVTLWRYVAAWQAEMKDNSCTMKAFDRCDTRAGSASV